MNSTRTNGESEPTLLALGDEGEATRAVASVGLALGCRICDFRSVDSMAGGLARLARSEIGCAVIDGGLRANASLLIYEQLLTAGLHFPALLIDRGATTATTVAAMRRGAIAVLEPPLRDDELRSLIEDGLAACRDDRRRRQYVQDLSNRFKQLAPEEREVLQMLLLGLKNEAMAISAGVSLRTIESRRGRVFEALQVNCVAEATRLVFEYEHNLAPRPFAEQSWASPAIDQLENQLRPSSCTEGD